MKKYLMFFIATWMVYPCNSQIKELPPHFIAADPNTLTFSAYDAFDARYSLNANVFKKTSGNENWDYKNVSLGIVSQVDIQNPLQLALFYQDFNTVVLLDNQLNEVRKIDFSVVSDQINVSAMGLASQNQLWIFNTFNQQIGRFDYLKNEYTIVSTPLSAKIKWYTASFNTFNWIDETGLGYSCAFFGTIESLGRFPAADQIQIINSKQIVYSVDQKIIVMNRGKDNLWTSATLLVPEKRFYKFYYHAQNLAIFTAEGIYNFKIILP
ncbi:MAG: hypothetical protein ACRC6O_12560 [Flavobacterium sp.]